MATWTGQKQAVHIFEAAAIWRQRCLLGSQSLFSESALWTRPNFEELRTLFVDNPISGKKKFNVKLQEQIGNAGPDICKLAAETLWLLYLFVSSSVMGVNLKRERIAEIWGLSKDTLPESNLLHDDELEGLANPGIAFLTKVWAEYGFLLTIMVAWKSLAPDEQTRLLKNNPWELCEWVAKIEGAGVRALRDEKKMALVFQEFVRNFFAIELDFTVTPLTMRWDAVSDKEEDLRMLPTMTTDIHLEKADRRIIIDTKYYKEPLQEHYGKQSIHSEHLYQLFSYLKNSEPRGPVYFNAEGILLYPAIGEKLSFKAKIQGHPVRVCSINLDQPWQMIRSDLLDVLLPP